VPEITPKWPGLDVGFLILETDTFIVFLDTDLDVDWQTTSKYDEAGPKDPSRHHEILNQAATLECVPNDHHSRSVRLNFKRMVGEGVARSLDHDYDCAEKILEQARSYIADRNVETARLWQLSTGCVLGVAIGIAGLVLWTLRTRSAQAWGDTVYFLLLSAVAGSLGAVLSMIFRMGRNFPNSEAPKSLHILEATSRVFAGCLSGLLVAGSVKMGLILSMFGDAQHLHLTMLVSAMASGASERWAPSLIGKIGASWSQRETNESGSQ
jgi:hypothetical protein